MTIRKSVFKFASLSVLSCLGLSCSTLSREPASVSKSPATEERTVSAVPTLSDVNTALTNYAGFIQSSSFSPQACSSLYNNINDKLAKLDWNSYSNEQLNAESKEIMGTMWKLQLQLHARLADVSSDCKLIVRKIFHRLQDHQDYLGEFAYTLPALDPSKLNFQKQRVPIYDRAAYPPYFVRPDVDDTKFQFHNGDIVIARGVSFFSAIISQVSDNKSHFSHIVFMNQDDKTKKISTIESYMGVGVRPYEINFALKNENARLLVLRAKDHDLADKAAGFANEYAKANVPYDYVSNFKDYSKMGCAEVAHASFDKASHGAVMAPEIPAQMNIHNEDFLKKIGYKNGDLVTPDDFATDSRFELLLDWRDYRLLRDSRQKDAILSELVRWTDELGYKFRDTPKSWIAKNIVLASRPTRLWPLVKKVTGSPDLDPNMPKSALGVMTVLGQVAEEVLVRIKKQDEAYFAKHKRPMTNDQLRAAVNTFREEDLNNYKDGRKPVYLHFFFRPDSAWPTPDMHNGD